MPTGPLAGVRVVDFTTIYSGPIATAILGDQGADVIKVESAEGDLMRRGRPRRNLVSASFAMINRNKRSIVIDARTKEGCGILLDLIKTADVLVENFRPGVMTRLGLGYETVNTLNPRLIYASINGVGSEGPYAKRRVYDAVIQGVSGIAALQSDPDTGRPQMINTLICDKITSLHAAQVISSALFAREKTGKGQQVELTMLDASLFFIWPDGMSNFGLVGDDVERMPFLDHRRFVRQTKDGYIAVMPVKAAEWEGTFHALIWIISGMTNASTRWIYASQTQNSCSNCSTRHMRNSQPMKSVLDSRRRMYLTLSSTPVSVCWKTRRFRRWVH